jgi:DNA-binding transcriptional ArsR family regulator
LSNSDSIVLEGTTLAVYVYIAKEGKSVGPRDVMRRLHLNSPSVAYRHLQKLEDSGLLTKTEYGEYSLKKKTKIRGYHWIGRTLLSNIFFLFYPFLALLIAELVILAIHFGVETFEFKVFFLLGISITVLAMVAFLVLGIVEIRKISRSATYSASTEAP